MEEKKVEKSKLQEKAPTCWDKVGILLIGVYLVIVALILIYLFVGFWPRETAVVSSPPEGRTTMMESEAGHAGETTGSPSSDVAESGEKTSWSEEVHILMFDFTVSHEVRIILLVIIAGALGSFIHVISSFVEYVGSKKFRGSWTWWYFLRPFSGSVLALIFYLIIRGGLLSTQIAGTDLSRFGVTGLAGLIGLFSKQAIDKLSELFTVMFKLEKEKKLPDPLEGETDEKAGEETTE